MSLSDLVKGIMEFGLSENQISEVLGVTVATVNKIKNGRTANPAYSVGKKIEHLYFSLCCRQK